MFLYRGKIVFHMLISHSRRTEGLYSFCVPLVLEIHVACPVGPCLFFEISALQGEVLWGYVLHLVYGSMMNSTFARKPRQPVPLPDSLFCFASLSRFWRELLSNSGFLFFLNRKWICSRWRGWNEQQKAFYEEGLFYWRISAYYYLISNYIQSSMFRKNYIQNDISQKRVYENKDSHQILVDKLHVLARYLIWILW